jgi:endonuclease G
MKKIKLIILIIIIIPLSIMAQNIDRIISNDVYSSYFNNDLKEPIYVSYKLYKAGGDCSRKSMSFHVDSIRGTSTTKDYVSSGYDEGHLADAADFAYDCKKEEETFRFYNCVPQTPHLNRGIWKHYETEIRKLSQSDSLLVITGSIFGSKKLLNSNVAIPDYCWKVVESLSTKTTYYSFIISNDLECKEANLLIEDLEKKLGYILPLKK